MKAHSKKVIDISKCLLLHNALKGDNSRYFDINSMNINDISNDNIDCTNSTIALVPHDSSSGSLKGFTVMVTQYCK